ncbi:HD family phosphohydrolase [Candidatus Formimonas warabiya]|uniref:HD family phosphohydrolase n=1 Tax=Formimonas warabiya TaxID=1761012 RepID=A0A3G1KVN2_FORW1|nr:HD family phosphohydrolase [Candidatus Formimonas warabiya]ATW26439.1 HD family phosphohydrolase [Candidatus Formimonas warabiya]
MAALIQLKMSLKADSSTFSEYHKCISDLIENDIVWAMSGFKHHGNITCLEHSVHVSYKSFLMCKSLGLDYRSAARGGLLHDLFLYDWHRTKPAQGWHGLVHPLIALENANKNFSLNKIEKDIIIKHMWPLTMNLPRYKESFIVLLVDKYCALVESMKFSRAR